MKAKEKLNALKAEIETLNKKLAELTDEELAQVSGGLIPPLPPSANHDHGQLTEKDKRIINCD